MSTRTQKYEAETRDFGARHSALEEFARDERRPAVLLLGALIIAVVFFALGIIFDRWTINRNLLSDSPFETATPSSNSSDARPARP